MTHWIYDSKTIKGIIKTFRSRLLRRRSFCRIDLSSVRDLYRTETLIINVTGFDYTSIGRDGIGSFILYNTIKVYNLPYLFFLYMNPTTGLSHVIYINTSSLDYILFCGERGELIHVAFLYSSSMIFLTWIWNGIGKGRDVCERFINIMWIHPNTRLYSL